MAALLTTQQLAQAMSVVGVVLDEDGNKLTVKVKGSSVSSSGNNTFIAAVTGKKIRVLAAFLQRTGASAVTAKFFDTQGTPAQITNSHEYLGQNTGDGVRLVAASGSFLFESASGQGVQINLSAAVAVFSHLEYVEV